MAGTSPYEGLRVLDLSRVLAGPWATQILADLGADVVKVEQPEKGDDTRLWGPPYLTDRDGNPTRESAYYLCTNRNKRSVAIDLTRPEGQDLIRRLAAQSDVLVENFRVDGLKKYGLDYASLAGRQRPPGLLLDHRLRPDRADARTRRLRPADPGDGRADEHHRPPRRPAGRRPGQGRRRRRRRVHRALCDHRHPGGARPPPGHRPRPAHRHGAVRHPGRGPRQPGDEHPVVRGLARPDGQRPPQRRPLPGVRHRHRPHRPRHRQRRPSSNGSAPSPASPSSPTTPASPPTRPASLTAPSWYR